MSKMMTSPEMHEFRAALAAKLGVADPDAPNEKLLKALDRKLAAAAQASSEPAKRARLDTEDRLYEIAWPSRPADREVGRADDQQLYDAAWGSNTEKEA